MDMATLPPCREALEQHIRRVNYQVAIWKRSHIANPDIPPATDSHGWTIIDGKLEPLWYDGDMLPKQLTDIVDRSSGDTSDSDSESDDEDEFAGVTEEQNGYSSDSDTDF